LKKKKTEKVLMNACNQKDLEMHYYKQEYKKKIVLKNLEEQKGDVLLEYLVLSKQ